MVERLVHVLIKWFLSWFEDGGIFVLQVHQEAIFGQVLLLLRWWTEDRQTDTMDMICGM